MGEEGPVEARQISIGESLDLVAHVRMAADGSLAVDDHGARQDVRALDRDPDRRRRIGPGQNIARPATDPRPGADVHGVAHDRAHAFGEVTLRDRGNDGGPLPCVDGARREGARSVHQIGPSPDPRQRLLDSLEAPDGRVELLADRRVGPDETRGELDRADRQGRKRDRPTRGQALHEHPPPLAGSRRPPDDEVGRHEDVTASVRAILERDAHRIVARADFDPGQVRRHQGA